MLLVIVLIFVLLVAGLLAFAATKPDNFRIERTAQIAAPPEKVFGYLNDFHRWAEWSPWENIDADLKRAYSGPSAGKGAIYEWEGQKTGMGRMEILESDLASRLLIQLDFIKPMQARNTTDFTLQAANDGTRVSWAMFGPSAYTHKLMTIFFNMDKVVGGDFAKGLTSLKALAES